MAKAIGRDGVEIYYECWGKRDGEPLLLIPGLGADRRMWACQHLVFGLRHRCIALDNRGVGRSGKPAGPYALTELADDAIAVLDAEGIDSAHVLGYSMGGAVAQLMAVLYQDRVRTLTLAATACRHRAWRRDLLADWQRLATERGIHAMARQAFPWLMGPTVRRFASWLNLLWPIILNQPAAAFASQVEAILSTSDEPRFLLSEISAPTLVITGSQDRLTPVEDAEELASLVPGARLVVVPGAAHGLAMEAAPAFNENVLRFLRENTGVLPAPAAFVPELRVAQA
jgi:3-oxoadipate enol-lactonase